MITTDPNLQTRILEWQKKYQIRDDDPAMALIELLGIYGFSPQGSVASAAGQATLSANDLKLIQDQGEALQRKLGELQSQLLSLPAQTAVGDRLPPPEEIRTLVSNTERTTFLLSELKETLSQVKLAEYAEQFKTYHEGIEFATQKMALIIKEGDDLLARLGKVAAQINPVARGAIFVLMLFSGVVGWLIAKLF
jgi:hypothetical protein